MKKFQLYLVILAAGSLLFTSCSKEENRGVFGGEKATLSFGAVLNDLVNNNSTLKQQLDFPVCSEDAPAYVDIVLSGTKEVGSASDPLRLTINPIPGDYDEDGVDEYFSDEHADLELEPGPYTLEWFVVRNQALEVIWVAPMAGGNMANFVDTALPFEFNLGAGVKKYVNVEVVCLDDRDVNEYGYLFFDLETTEAFKYCFFGNYCDENGRHYPASYSVDIWLGTDSTGEVLYTDVVNATGTNDDGDAFATPLCFALPNLTSFEDDEDYLYYEVTLLDWEGVYGEVDQYVISGTLNRNEIVSNHGGENVMEYEHIKFNCTETDEVAPIGNDECFAEGLDREGSSVQSAWLQNSDSGFVEASLISRTGIWLGGDEYEFGDRRFSRFTLRLEENNRNMGNVEFSLQDPTHLELIFNIDVEWVMNSYVLEVRDSLGSEIYCYSLSWRENEDMLSNYEFKIVYELSEEFEAPIYVRLQAGLVCGWGCD